MTRGLRLLATIGLALLPLLLISTSAPAASNDVIRDLQIEIEIRDDGSLAVTETYDWDFGSRQGLGLTRVLDARFDYEPDPQMVRVYRYDRFSASSPTGAPAGVWPHREGAGVRVDVGAPDGSDDRRSGRQTYVLTYTVDGALNAIRDQAGVADQDELYWNVTGHDWQIPIENVEVRVEAAATVVDHACYQGGRGSQAECDTLEADGGAVEAATGQIAPGSGVTIMAAYPPGTFGDIAPILEARPSTSAPFRGDAAPRQENAALAAAGSFLGDHWPWLAPLALALPVGFGVIRVRRGRDLHYADFPPGVLPPPRTAARVEQLSGDPAVAVRFTPPDDLRPGEVGAVSAKTVSTTQISATLIDLAVRGYLRLEEAGTSWRGKVNDWTFIATPENAPAEELRDYERILLDRIFRRRRQVRLSQLRNTFAGTMRKARGALAEGLRREGLVAQRLGSGSGRAFLLIPLTIMSVSVLGIGRGVSELFLGPSTTVVIVSVVLLLVSLLVAALVTRRARIQRTAPGRALYEQSRGFQRYLTTAEAHQLRFEEGEDIFSRYLPYAIVYGVAERWAGIFAELEAQGARVARPTWYASPHGLHAGSFQHLGSSLSSFSSMAGSALSSTPGSSGGSGSRGGGGGSSGGGGGGGGGGGR